MFSCVLCDVRGRLLAVCCLLVFVVCVLFVVKCRLCIRCCVLLAVWCLLRIVPLSSFFARGVSFFGV